MFVGRDLKFLHPHVDRYNVERISIPGGRDARAVLDGDPDADAVVVACPPHPQMGGSSSDQRVRAVSDALGDRRLACLRIDYGPWSEGRGEQTDARNALGWARDRFETVGLFGYSFGAGVALLAAAEARPEPTAVSALAAPARLDDGTETAPAIERIDCPLQVVYGERDDTVDYRPVVERARERGANVEAVPADHHFVGQTQQVADLVAGFLADVIADS